SCSTAHSLAFRAVGHQFRARLRGPRVPGRETARILGINDPFRVSDDRVLAPEQVARVAMDTVRRFCFSAADGIDAWHVPEVNGIDAERNELAALVVPLARKAWSDLTSVDGSLPFTHDVYLKLWQLSSPRLDADFILL